MNAHCAECGAALDHWLLYCVECRLGRRALRKYTVRCILEQIPQAEADHVG